jgi:hypothetical protein
VVAQSGGGGGEVVVRVCVGVCVCVCGGGGGGGGGVIRLHPYMLPLQQFSGTLKKLRHYSLPQ